MFRIADYKAMSKELGRLSEIIGSVKEELSGMRECAGNLDLYWDGEANAQFILKVNEGVYNAEIILEKLRRAGYFLSYALSRYQSSEKEILRIIQEE